VKKKEDVEEGKICQEKTSVDKNFFFLEKQRGKGVKNKWE